MIVLILVCLTIWAFVSYYVKIHIEIDDVEAELFMQNIMASPNGVSYTDDIRTYSGTIMFSEWDSLTSRLEKAFYNEQNKFIAAKLQLLDTARQPMAQEIYYNKQYYDKHYTLAKTGFIGRGSANIYEKELPVTVIKDTGKELGILKIIVTTPKS